jgi:DNA/RNA-binding domain of Phe-tRNA-synthetase-like protein
MAVFGVAPDYVRVSLQLSALEPDRAAPAAAALLARAGQAARGLVADDPRLAGWRDPYLALGVPDDVPTPPEVLAAWAEQPGGVPSQGALNDLVNAFALQHCVPVSAHDLARVVGDLWLRPSRGLEWYEPLGGGAPESPALGELILVDSADQVLARHWHGAPGRVAAVGSASREALVLVDLVPPLAEAAGELSEQLLRLLTGFLGGQAEVRRLSRAAPSAEWAA